MDVYIHSVIPTPTGRRGTDRYTNLSSSPVELSQQWTMGPCEDLGNGTIREWSPGIALRPKKV